MNRRIPTRPLSAPRRPASPWRRTRATAAAWSAVAPVRVICVDSNASGLREVVAGGVRRPTAASRRARRSGRRPARAARSRRPRSSSAAGTTLGRQPEGQRLVGLRWCAGSRAARSPWPGPTSRWRVKLRAGVARERDVGEGQVEARRCRPRSAGRRRRPGSAPAPAATPLTAAITGFGHPGQRGHDRVVVLVDGAEQRVASTRCAGSRCAP